MPIRAEDVLKGLGGSANILEIEPCVTRLRAEIDNPALVDAAALRRIGCHGVLMRGSAVQLVVGPCADTLATDLGDLAWSLEATSGR